MPPPRKPISAASLPAPRRPSTVVTCVVAWLFPGAGHWLQGQQGKAVVFAATLFPMYVIGLMLGGRLFPFQMVEPLVLLASLAQWMMGLTHLVAGSAGYGAGDVVAASYEYGNTFLIVSGLLNALVVFDAADLARGYKPLVVRERMS